MWILRSNPTRAWRRIEGVEIVAACDVDLAKAQALRAAGVRRCVEMLRTEELDFVDIATRPDTHKALAYAAGERRIPAICQKPMAPDLESAVEMARAAECMEVPLMIHENWRWQPVVSRGASAHRSGLTSACPCRIGSVTASVTAWVPSRIPINHTSKTCRGC